MLLQNFYSILFCSMLIATYRSEQDCQKYLNIADLANQPQSRAAFFLIGQES